MRLHRAPGGVGPGDEAQGQDQYQGLPVDARGPEEVDGPAEGLFVDDVYE